MFACAATLFSIRYCLMRSFVNVKPHFRVAFTPLKQLRSTDDLPVNEIKEACIREDEAEAEPAFFSKFRNRRNSGLQAANGLVLFCAQVIKTNSLIISPKQLAYEGSVNKNPITFLLDGGADHSIMSRAFALTNRITTRPLDPPIATISQTTSLK
ncbi:hypothetical protein Efla_000248 [Eimeria flavescens]